MESPGQVVAVGDRLIRVGMRDGGMLTSSDGLNWEPAELGSDDIVYFDARIATSDGRAHLRSWNDDGDWRLWSSADGQVWSVEPTPVTPGRLTGTSEAVVSVGDATEGACDAGIGPGDDVDAALSAQWQCAVTLTVEVLSAGSKAWTPVRSLLPIRTPSVPGVSAFGNQLVAAVEGSDGSLSVWLSTDGAVWHGGDVDVEDTDTGRPPGTPQGFRVAAQNDSTIIIPVSSSGVGDLGQLVIGRIVEQGEN